MGRLRLIGRIPRRGRLSRRCGLLVGGRRHCSLVGKNCHCILFDEGGGSRLVLDYWFWPRSFDWASLAPAQEMREAPRQASGDPLISEAEPISILAQPTDFFIASFYVTAQANDLGLKRLDPILSRREALRAQGLDLAQGFVALGSGLAEHRPEMHDFDVLSILARARLFQKLAGMSKPSLFAHRTRLEQPDKA